MSGGYVEYIIVGADFDNFIIKVYDNDRPNNATDDELISDYMGENWFGHSYEAIDINNTGYETVELNKRC